MQEPILHVRIIQEALLDILGEQFFVSRVGWTVTAGERLKFAENSEALRSIKFQYRDSKSIYFTIVAPPEVNLDKAYRVSLTPARYTTDELPRLISDVKRYIEEGMIPADMLKYQDEVSCEIDWDALFGS